MNKKEVLYNIEQIQKKLSKVSFKDYDQYLLRMRTEIADFVIEEIENSELKGYERGFCLGMSLDVDK